MKALRVVGYLALYAVAILFAAGCILLCMLGTGCKKVTDPALNPLPDSTQDASVYDMRHGDEIREQSNCRAVLGVPVQLPASPGAKVVSAGIPVPRASRAFTSTENRRVR